MLRRLGIRGKVLAALSVPVLVLVAFAGVLSVQSLLDIRTARTVADLLDTLDGARELAEAIQVERDATIFLVTDESDDLSEVEAARRATDVAVGVTRRSAADVDLNQLDPIVERAVAGLVEQVDSLERVRQLADGGQTTARLAFQDYTAVVESVVRFPAIAADALPDRPLAGIITAQADVASLQEKYRQEQIFGTAMLRGADGSAEGSVFTGLFPATDIQHRDAIQSVADLGVEELEVPRLNTATGTYGSQRSSYSEYVQSFINWGQSERWYELADDEVASYDRIGNDLASEASTRSRVVQNSALRGATITIAASLLAVALSVVIALTIARQIVGPLRRLTEAAGHVRDELPRLVEQVAVPGQGPDLSLARIPVDSEDEVGRLATAFNEVNSTTIEVAQEQAALRASIAEMFVNVARRDQVLLNRQLSFIDALERSEEDPATLADLFRLDHLATRMRRNAESLLVLAGIDTGRRLREPLPLSDVIRTASSEIEHYERIQLDLPIDPLMLGHTALPSAHLLAELLENATVFSDPGTPVHVSTGREADHMVVTVHDQGLGMMPDEMMAANEKIRASSASDVLGSERLGLFVVGRIASRLGASVEVLPGPDGTGTLAIARFPVALFVAPESVPLTEPSRLMAAEQPMAPPQGFLPPEQIAGPSGEPPVLTGPQDVAAGAVGSAENPAQEFDLAQLTDGTTGLGLPKRRSRDDEEPAAQPELPTRASNVYRDQDDAAAASSIPLAPRAEDLAGAAGFPAAEEEAWTPPVIESKPLVVRRRTADGGADENETRSSAEQGLPTRTPALPTRSPAAPAADGPTTGGLPTRAPTTGNLPMRTPAAPAPAAFAAPSEAAPANPQERASMFTGFRSRRAELAAASLGNTEANEGVDGAERLAAAASGTASFFSRGREATADDGTQGPDPTESAQPVAEAALTAESAPADEVAEQPTWPRFPAADTAEHSHEDIRAAATEAPASQAPAAPAEPSTATGSTPAAGEPLTRRARRGRHAYYPDQGQTPVWTPPPTREPIDQLPTREPIDQVPTWAPSEPRAEAYQAQSPAPAAEPIWAVPALEDDEPAQTWETAETQAAPSAGDAYAEQPTADAYAEQPAAQGWGSDQPTEVWQADHHDEQSWSGAAAAHTEPPMDTRPEQPAAPQWSAPETAWGGLASSAEAAPAPEPESKRRWWQLGRKKSDAAEASTNSAPTRPSTGTPRTGMFDPTASAPGPITPPVPAAPSAPSPTEPAPERSSAWGPPQGGTHTGGATSFFRPRDGEGAPAPAAQGTGGWDVPTPHSTSETPIVTPAGEEQPGGWGVAETPHDQWAQAKPPTAEQPPAPQAPVAPAAFAPSGARSTTFTPQDTGFDDDVTNMLAQRADLAQQALAELSQLSSYRPQTVSGGGGSLVRRTPEKIPAAPAIKTSSVERPARDANQVRSLLSSFQSGTVRGREAADGAPQTAGVPSTGAEDDGQGNGPQSVGDPDLTQRSTAW